MSFTKDVLDRNLEEFAQLALISLVQRVQASSPTVRVVVTDKDFEHALNHIVCIDLIEEGKYRVSVKKATEREKKLAEDYFEKAKTGKWPTKSRVIKDGAFFMKVA